MSILLKERKAKILQLLVQDYIENCEPVGSKRIAENYGIEVRSATIRNEMAELSEMGLLTQPHRSAGRIPSELGYRVFVDSLMERCSMPSEASRIITRALRQKNEIEMLVSAACRVLSELCGYAAAACYPSMKNSYINYISLARYGAKRLLLVAGTSDSLIIHRLLNTEKPLFSMDSAINFLTSVYRGRLVSDIVQMSPAEGMFAPVSAEFLEAVKSEGRDKRDRKFYYEGIGRLLRLPEFRSVENLEALINVLENDSLMEKITGFAESAEPAVRIGSETGIPALSGYSVVSAGYRLSDKPAGGIAVIGPTRMDYSRSIAAADLVREQLEIMLNSILK
ncbi:MAG: heat-inducible transcription repressor HrcA [Abditibacteriota bacterium]|nr:heat-inducible transcription repressor HrcA [Abditibacteriota bacterium]